VNLEEFNMGIPKRKNDINVYGNKPVEYGSDVMDRRQELLNMITKSNSYLPESVLHDDLDMGMLDFIKENFEVISDGQKIPVVDKIMTIQRWGEFANNWSFSDDDGNPKIPLIAVIRKPDAQIGKHPSTIYTIPDRQTFYYATVPTWNGNQMGADVYKIPQPVAVDLTFDVTIVCTKFRDLNKFSKLIMQKFSSRQAYTTIKGHYIPIILDTIADNTPMESLDSRRFYLQTYTFIMMGLLIDNEEFEVKPAINRALLMTEFIIDNPMQKTLKNGGIDITTVSFKADGIQTIFSVGEPMTNIFNIYVNNELITKDINYLHIPGTSKITMLGAPQLNDIVTIQYYKGKKSTKVDNINSFINSYGKIVYLFTDNIRITNRSPFMNLSNDIDTFISLDINGLAQIEGTNFIIQNTKQIKLLGIPSIGSVVNIKYLY
jgi:hypothetical protein